jgi:hypothetical protein
VFIIHFVPFSLCFKDQRQVCILYNAAHFKTVIPRGDQHETGAAQSEGGAH